jgi:hypothetical protein
MNLYTEGKKMLAWEDVQKHYEGLYEGSINEISTGRPTGSIIDTYQEGLLSLYDRWNEFKHLPIDEFMHVFNPIFPDTFSTTLDEVEKSSVEDLSLHREY